ncbi:MAG: MBL fold metallo-hydrolase [Treponema sp.]|nr:MBL fold metallo-hydrolase [Treponema sp.]
MAEVFRVTDYLFFRRANLPVRGQCNGAFIVGEREVVIVDAPPEGIEMADEAEKLFHKPVTALCLTHGHTDHVNGLAPYLERDITVYCNYRILSYLAPADYKGRAGFAGINGNLTLRLSGGIDVELFILGETAHSKGDMFIRMPAIGLLCTGDSVVEYQTAYFHGADIRGWIHSLELLAATNGKLILAGHSPEILPYSYITEFAGYLSTIEKCARGCFMRFHPELLDKIEEERFANVTTDEVKELVEQFFSERTKDAVFLEEKAGPVDARRCVRMVLWELIREWIR